MIRSGSFAYVTAMLAVALCGCAKMGPGKIPSARINYCEAIVRSANEQLLLNLVRLRYRDVPLFLDLGSVVTQYSDGNRNPSSVSKMV